MSARHPVRPKLDKHRDRQTDRQTDRTDRQTDRQKSANLSDSCAVQRRMAPNFADIEHVRTTSHLETFTYQTSIFGDIGSENLERIRPLAVFRA